MIHDGSLLSTWNSAVDISKRNNPNVVFKGVWPQQSVSKINTESLRTDASIQGEGGESETWGIQVIDPPANHRPDAYLGHLATRLTLSCSVPSVPLLVVVSISM